MEFLIEVILQFLFEFLMQIFGEVICEMGMQSLAEVFQRKQVKNPVLAGFGYFLLGAIIGGISLLIVGSTLIRNSNLRILNLFLAPTFAGLVMVAIGLFRRKTGRNLVRLDRFSYGFIFAFGMASVRFAFAARPT